MKKIIWILSLLNVCAIYGEAISVDTLESFQLTPIQSKYIRDVEIVRVKDKKQPSVLNFATVPSNYTPIENVRFENAKDLSKVVEMILNYKTLHPEKVQWAVFDVDETLIDRNKSSQPIHPETNNLFKKLNDGGVPIILLTMSSDLRPKFKRAGLAFDGVITEGLLSRDSDGMFVPKGETLKRYIQSLPRKKRPEHVFFADDQLFSDPGVERYLGKIPVYIQSVEESMKESGIPFTTFHFQKKLSSS